MQEESHGADAVSARDAPLGSWTRGRRRQALRLSIPIIGGMVSQNVFNLIDTAMVGTLGDEALAAVGLGGVLHFVTSAFVLGLSNGVQAMASRRLGEEQHDRTAIPLNGGILLALVIGIPWSLSLIGLTPWFYPYLHDDPAVVARGAPYLQARLAGMTAMGVNFSFRGYWNAVGRPGLYMQTLMVIHAANIVLNWVLIFGNLGAPALGTTGAGAASAIAMWIGTGVYMGMGARYARAGGFARALPARETLGTMVRVSAPVALQHTFFAGGMTVFMWIVGHVGTAELAATHVIVNLLLVGLLPSIGFGLAAASLVGHALGRRDTEDAWRWGWDVVRIAMLAVALVALPLAIAPEFFLGLFIHEPRTIAIAQLPLRIVAVFLPLDALRMVLLNGLTGSGYTRPTMVVSVTLQWLLFLPAAYVIGPVLGAGLIGLWVANIAYRQLQCAAYVIMWQRRRWAAVRI